MDSSFKAILTGTVDSVLVAASLLFRGVDMVSV